jgi:hypothetical protein
MQLHHNKPSKPVKSERQGEVGRGVGGGNCTVPHSSSYQTLQKINPRNEINVLCAVHMKR